MQDRVTYETWMETGNTARGRMVPGSVVCRSRWICPGMPCRMVLGFWRVCRPVPAPGCDRVWVLASPETVET